MKNFLISIIFVLSACSTNLTGEFPRPAPELRFYSLKGETFGLDEFKGKNLAIVFWATWCPYCRDLMDEIHTYLNGSLPKDFELLFVSLDRDDHFQEVVEFLKERKLIKAHHSYSGNFTLDEAYVLIGASAVPSIYIIDSNRNIIDGGHNISLFKKYLKP